MGDEWADVTAEGYARYRRHTDHFQRMGFRVGGTVVVPDGRLGTLTTLPGLDEHGDVPVLLLGGTPHPQLYSIYDLIPFELPDLKDIDAVDEWLRE